MLPQGLECTDNSPTLMGGVNSIEAYRGAMDAAGTMIITCNINHSDRCEWCPGAMERVPSVTYCVHTNNAVASSCDTAMVPVGVFVPPCQGRWTSAACVHAFDADPLGFFLYLWACRSAVGPLFVVHHPSLLSHVGIVSC